MLFPDRFEVEPMQGPRLPYFGTFLPFKLKVPDLGNSISSRKKWERPVGLDDGRTVPEAQLSCDHVESDNETIEKEKDKKCTEKDPVLSHVASKPLVLFFASTTLTWIPWP